MLLIFTTTSIVLQVVFAQLNTSNYLDIQDIDPTLLQKNLLEFSDANQSTMHLLSDLALAFKGLPKASLDFHDDKSLKSHLTEGENTAPDHVFLDSNIHKKKKALLNRLKRHKHNHVDVNKQIKGKFGEDKNSADGMLQDLYGTGKKISPKMKKEDYDEELEEYGNCGAADGDEDEYDDYDEDEDEDDDEDTDEQKNEENLKLKRVKLKEMGKIEDLLLTADSTLKESTSRAGIKYNNEIEGLKFDLTKDSALKSTCDQKLNVKDDQNITRKLEGINPDDELKKTCESRNDKTKERLEADDDQLEVLKKTVNKLDDLIQDEEKYKNINGSKSLKSLKRTKSEEKSADLKTNDCIDHSQSTSDINNKFSKVEKDIAVQIQKNKNLQIENTGNLKDQTEPEKIKAENQENGNNGKTNEKELNQINSVVKDKVKTKDKDNKVNEKFDKLRDGLEKKKVADKKDRSGKSNSEGKSNSSVEKTDVKEIQKNEKKSTKDPETNENSCSNSEKTPVKEQVKIKPLYKKYSQRMNVKSKPDQRGESEVTGTLKNKTEKNSEQEKAKLDKETKHERKFNTSVTKNREVKTKLCPQTVDNMSKGMKQDKLKTEGKNTRNETSESDKIENAEKFQQIKGLTKSANIDQVKQRNEKTSRNQISDSGETHKSAAESINTKVINEKTVSKNIQVTTESTKTDYTKLNCINRDSKNNECSKSACKSDSFSKNKIKLDGSRTKLIERKEGTSETQVEKTTGKNESSRNDKKPAVASDKTAKENKLDTYSKDNTPYRIDIKIMPEREKIITSCSDECATKKAAKWPKKVKTKKNSTECSTTEATSKMTETPGSDRNKTESEKIGKRPVESSTEKKRASSTQRGVEKGVRYRPKIGAKSGIENGRKYGTERSTKSETCIKDGEETKTKGEQHVPDSETHLIQVYEVKMSPKQNDGNLKEQDTSRIKLDKKLKDNTLEHGEKNSATSTEFSQKRKEKINSVVKNKTSMQIWLSILNKMRKRLNKNQEIELVREKSEKHDGPSEKTTISSDKTSTEKVLKAFIIGHENFLENDAPKQIFQIHITRTNHTTSESRKPQKMMTSSSESYSDASKANMNFDFLREVEKDKKNVSKELSLMEKYWRELENEFETTRTMASEKQKKPFSMNIFKHNFFGRGKNKKHKSSPKKSKKKLSPPKNECEDTESQNILKQTEMEEDSSSAMPDSELGTETMQVISVVNSTDPSNENTGESEINSLLGILNDQDSERNFTDNYQRNENTDDASQTISDDTVKTNQAEMDPQYPSSVTDTDIDAETNSLVNEETSETALEGNKASVQSEVDKFKLLSKQEVMPKSKLSERIRTFCFGKRRESRQLHDSRNKKVAVKDNTHKYDVCKTVKGSFEPRMNLDNQNEDMKLKFGKTKLDFLASQLKPSNRKLQAISDDFKESLWSNQNNLASNSENVHFWQDLENNPIIKDPTDVSNTTGGACRNKQEMESKRIFQIALDEEVRAPVKKVMSQFCTVHRQQKRDVPSYNSSTNYSAEDPGKNVDKLTDSLRLVISEVTSTQPDHNSGALSMNSPDFLRKEIVKSSNFLDSSEKYSSLRGVTEDSALNNNDQKPHIDFSHYTTLPNFLNSNIQKDDSPKHDIKNSLITLYQDSPLKIYENTTEKKLENFIHNIPSGLIIQNTTDIGSNNVFLPYIDHQNIGSLTFSNWSAPKLEDVFENHQNTSILKEDGFHSEKMINEGSQNFTEKPLYGFQTEELKSKKLSDQYNNITCIIKQKNHKIHVPDMVNKETTQNNSFGPSGIKDNKIILDLKAVEKPFDTNEPVKIVIQVTTTKGHEIETIIVEKNQIKGENENLPRVKHNGSIWSEQRTNNHFLEFTGNNVGSSNINLQDDKSIINKTVQYLNENENSTKANSFQAKQESITEGFNCSSAHSNRAVASFDKVETFLSIPKSCANMKIVDTSAIKDTDNQNLKLVSTLYTNNSFQNYRTYFTPSRPNEILTLTPNIVNYSKNYQKNEIDLSKNNPSIQSNRVDSSDHWQSKKNLYNHFPGNKFSENIGKNFIEKGNYQFYSPIQKQAGQDQYRMEVTANKPSTEFSLVHKFALPALKPVPSFYNLDARTTIKSAEIKPKEMTFPIRVDPSSLHGYEFDSKQTIPASVIYYRPALTKKTEIESRTMPTSITIVPTDMSSLQTGTEAQIINASIYMRKIEQATPYPSIAGVTVVTENPAFTVMSYEFNKDPGLKLTTEKNKDLKIQLRPQKISDSHKTINFILTPPTTNFQYVSSNLPAQINAQSMITTISASPGPYLSGKPTKKLSFGSNNAVLSTGQNMNTLAWNKIIPTSETVLPVHQSALLYEQENKTDAPKGSTTFTIKESGVRGESSQLTGATAKTNKLQRGMSVDYSFMINRPTSKTRAFQIGLTKKMEYNEAPDKVMKDLTLNSSPRATPITNDNIWNYKSVKNDSKQVTEFDSALKSMVTNGVTDIGFEEKIAPSGQKEGITESSVTTEVTTVSFQKWGGFQRFNYSVAARPKLPTFESTIGAYQIGPAEKLTEKLQNSGFNMIKNRFDLNSIMLVNATNQAVAVRNKTDDLNENKSQESKNKTTKKLPCELNNGQNTATTIPQAGKATMRELNLNSKATTTVLSNSEPYTIKKTSMKEPVRQNQTGKSTSSYIFNAEENDCESNCLVKKLADNNDESRQNMTGEIDSAGSMISAAIETKKNDTIEVLSVIPQRVSQFNFSVDSRKSDTKSQSKYHQTSCSDSTKRHQNDGHRLNTEESWQNVKNVRSRVKESSHNGNNNYSEAKSETLERTTRLPIETENCVASTTKLATVSATKLSDDTAETYETSTIQTTNKTQSSSEELSSAFIQNETLDFVETPSNYVCCGQHKKISTINTGEIQLLKSEKKKNCNSTQFSDDCEEDLYAKHGTSLLEQKSYHDKPKIDKNHQTCGSEELTLRKNDKFDRQEHEEHVVLNSNEKSTKQNNTFYPNYASSYNTNKEKKLTASKLAQNTQGLKTDKMHGMCSVLRENIRTSSEGNEIENKDSKMHQSEDDECNSDTSKLLNPMIHIGVTADKRDENKCHQDTKILDLRVHDKFPAKLGYLNKETDPTVKSGGNKEVAERDLEIKGYEDAEGGKPCLHGQWVKNKDLSATSKSERKSNNEVEEYGQKWNLDAVSDAFHCDTKNTTQQKSTAGVHCNLIPRPVQFLSESHKADSPMKQRHYWPSNAELNSPEVQNKNKEEKSEITHRDKSLANNYQTSESEPLKYTAQHSNAFNEPKSTKNELSDVMNQNQKENTNFCERNQLHYEERFPQNISQWLGERYSIRGPLSAEKMNALGTDENSLYAKKRRGHLKSNLNRNSFSGGFKKEIDKKGDIVEERFTGEVEPLQVSGKGSREKIKNRLPLREEMELIPSGELRDVPLGKNTDEKSLPDTSIYDKKKTDEKGMAMDTYAISMDGKQRNEDLNDRDLYRNRYLQTNTFRKKSDGDKISDEREKDTKGERLDDLDLSYLYDEEEPSDDREKKFEQDAGRDEIIYDRGLSDSRRQEPEPNAQQPILEGKVDLDIREKAIHKSGNIKDRKNLNSFKKKTKVMGKTHNEGLYGHGTEKRPHSNQNEIFEHDAMNNLQNLSYIRQGSKIIFVANDPRKFMGPKVEKEGHRVHHEPHSKIKMNLAEGKFEENTRKPGVKDSQYEDYDKDASQSVSSNTFGEKNAQKYEDGSNQRRQHFKEETATHRDIENIPGINQNSLNEKLKGSVSERYDFPGVQEEHYRFGQRLKANIKRIDSIENHEADFDNSSKAESKAGFNAVFPYKVENSRHPQLDLLEEEENPGVRRTEKNYQNRKQYQEVVLTSASTTEPLINVTSTDSTSTTPSPTLNIPKTQITQNVLPTNLNYPLNFPPTSKDQNEDETMNGKLAVKLVEEVVNKVQKSKTLANEFGLCKQNLTKIKDEVMSPQAAAEAKMHADVVREIMATINAFLSKQPKAACIALPTELKLFLAWLVEDDAENEPRTNGIYEKNRNHFNYMDSESSNSEYKRERKNEDNRGTLYMRDITNDLWPIKHAEKKKMIKTKHSTRKSENAEKNDWRKFSDQDIKNSKLLLSSLRSQLNSNLAPQVLTESAEDERSKFVYTPSNYQNDFGATFKLNENINAQDFQHFISGSKFKNKFNHDVHFRSRPVDGGEPSYFSDLLDPVKGNYEQDDKVPNKNDLDSRGNLYPKYMKNAQLKSVKGEDSAENIYKYNHKHTRRR